MKTIPAGPQKRITFDPRAVEANLPRVRRHEPVFLVEVEEGDRWVTHRASRVDVHGLASTLYSPHTGRIRFVTADEVVLDFDQDDKAGTAAAAAESAKGTTTTTATKKTRKTEKTDG